MTLPNAVAAEFPIAMEATYLNHAASAPLPARSAAVLRQYVDDRQRLYHLYQTGTQDYDTTELRKKLGRLLGVPAARVGFVPTTTDGIGMVLNGLSWRPGDNVVVPANEFPGVMYACLHLASRGVEVRQVPVPSGHLELTDLFAKFDRRTRAAVVSHVHWHTGHRIDLGALAEACVRRGVLSIVDAIQGVGAAAVDLAATPVDVLLAGSYKWLMGAHGLAAIAVSERAFEAIVPDRAGWASMATSVHARPELVWAPDARRYSVGGSADPALMVLEASVDLLLGVGVAAIETHIGSLLVPMAAGLAGAGLTLNTRMSATPSPTFLNATTGDPDRDRALVARLVAERIIVARRGPGIRISPHLYNTAADVDRLLRAVTD
ncbi:MAG: aminotransferase class V-fold PLP-dependent enzyme [Gemmatimonadales bacterium]